MVSDGIDPDQAYAIYRKRDRSERLISILRSAEGGKANFRKTADLYGKFAMLFISSLILFEIEEKWKQLDLDLDPYSMIREADRLSIVRTEKGGYELVRNLTDQQKLLFESFGLKQIDLACIAEDFDRRSMKGAFNPAYRLPGKDGVVVLENTSQVLIYC